MLVPKAVDADEEGDDDDDDDSDSSDDEARLSVAFCTHVMLNDCLRR